MAQPSPKRLFGPADAHRRQVAQLAGRLPLTGAVRLERLRGFGAPLGMLVTCGCARLEFADGSHGILIAAAEPVGRAMPLVERLQRLVEGIDTPIAAFARDGMFVGASDAARPLLGFRNLSEAGLDEARSDALKQGRVETPIGIGHMVLQRVGSGADVGLVALIAPAAIQAASTETAPVAPAAERPMPDYEQPATSGEAPAEFALIDEFATPAPSRRKPCPTNAGASRRRRRRNAPMPDYEQPQISGEAAGRVRVDRSRAMRPLQLDVPHAEASPAEAAPPQSESAATSPRPLSKPSPTSRRRRLRPRRHRSTSPRRSPPPPAALHVADGCRRPLFARLRRIHPPDRRAHRRGLRPAVERNRRRRSRSIPTAASSRRSPPAIPGAASP